MLISRFLTGLVGSIPTASVNLCYKLERRHDPYASEFDVVVGWVPTDVSKAFKERNFVTV